MNIHTHFITKMHLPSLTLLLSALFTITSCDPTPQATTLTFYLPSTFPNSVYSLSPQTTLFLTTTGREKSALLSRNGEFVIYNVTIGSYLADVTSREWVFAPQRVDVTVGPSGALVVDSALTFRGNEWENMGEKRRGLRIAVVPVKAVEYYTKREGFNPMKSLGSPMILIAIFSFAGMYFIPKLIENMDPELKAELEEAQKRSLAGPAAFGAGRNPIEGFDLAGFLSGAGSASASAAPAEPNTKGGKRKQ